jgi:hypothetical protein
MRHRASDSNAAFDTASYGRVFDDAGYGGGFVVTADTAGFPGGFEAYPQPTTERALSRGRPFAVAGTAAVALLGAALVLTGATQSVRGDSLTGLPMPQAGPPVIAIHQAGPPASHHTRPAVQAAGPKTSQQSPPPTTTPAYGAVKPAQGAQLPNTIRLPKGGTAYLVHVQVADDGSLPIPSGVNQAVWWGTGLTAPTGATVFAGHVNWAGSIGPFAELWQDTAGAVITVRDNAGNQLRYQVTQVLTLDKSQLPQQAPMLFSASGPPRIVLATCGGEWVGGSLGYADNRVVVATPIGN